MPIAGFDFSSDFIVGATTHAPSRQILHWRLLNGTSFAIPSTAMTAMSAQRQRGSDHLYEGDGADKLDGGLDIDWLYGDAD